MAIYDLTNEIISSSFNQLLQKNDDTGYLVDGTGSVIDGLSITGSLSASYFSGDGSGLTNLPIDPLPSGLVSGSSQIILQDTTGLLTGSRINGPVSKISSTLIPGGGGAVYGIALIDADNRIGFANNVAIGIDPQSQTIISTNFDGNLSGTATSASVAISSSYAVTASYALNAVSDTGSLLLTASFDNGTRDLTFTKGDSSTFSVNIPDVSGSVLPEGVVSGSSQIILQDTTGLLSGSRIDGIVATATNSTYSQNTITTGKNLSGAEILKGTPLFFTASGTSGNIVGIYPADAGNPSRMPAGGIAGETIADEAEGVVLLDGFISGVNTEGFPSGAKVYVGVGGGYTITPPTGSANEIQYLGNIEKSATNGSGVIQMMGESRGLPNIQENNLWLGDVNDVPQSVNKNNLGLALTGSDNTFTGNQIFNDITVNGTGSFAHINYVTGSATIIGDAFVVLNADTPTQRYAGLIVFDSGSGATASLEWDGEIDTWIAVEETGKSAVTLTGPTGSKGSETFPTENKIQKGLGWNYVGDSNITDDGTTISLNGNTDITGSLLINGNSPLISSDLSSLNAFTESQEGLNATFATTGSNSFVGNQIVSGDITATRMTLTGGAGNDLIVSGTIQSTLGMFPIGGVLTGNVGGLRTFAGDYGFYNGSGSNNASIGITIDNVGYGNTGWDGPALWVNDSTDSYPALIGFQKKEDWTDGTVSILKPLSVTGSVSIQGNQTINGTLTANFDAPANNNEVAIVNLNGATISGKSYNRAYFGVADYSGYGPEFEDYFAIEYYDSFGYNFGSELDVNGKWTSLLSKASGSGMISSISTIDNYDGTSQVTITSPHKVSIVGSLEAQNFTASLQEGYVWVGDENGRTVTAATSSFGGGGGGPATVTNLSVVSNTASIDLSLGTKFYLDLPAASSTELLITNRVDGESFSLLVSQSSAGTGSITFGDDTIKFAGGIPYQATNNLSAEDVVSFEIFNKEDGSGNKYVYVASVKNLS